MVIIFQLAQNSPEIDEIMRRKILDQHRQDCENLNTELNYQLEKQHNELEAKLAARRARKMKDAQRQNEEEAAQRFLDQQVSGQSADTKFC